MYLTHFRLRDRPFKLTQDLSYYFGPPHQVPLDELSYAIEEEQGLALLIGQHGTGKTTVMKRLLQSLPTHFEGVLLSDHFLGGCSLLAPLASMLRLPSPGNEPHRLAESLAKRMSGGTRVVLLVDEAQALSIPQLEEVRFLTNLEQEGRRLLEIVLSGPQALLERLSHPELAALRQRVAVQTVVEPLDRPQTEAYIRHRLRIAGSEQPLFDASALDAIQELTGGVPRLVNVLCDRALVVAYAMGFDRVNASIIDAARGDLSRVEVTAESASPDSSRVLELLERIEHKQDRILELLEERGVDLSEHPWLDGLRGSS